MILKTLKDVSDVSNPIDLSAKFNSDLKQVAIEWVKELEKSNFEVTPLLPFDENAKIIATDWIKMFFNLTEKDLQ